MNANRTLLLIAAAIFSAHCTGSGGSTGDSAAAGSSGSAPTAQAVGQTDDFVTLNREHGQLQRSAEPRYVTIGRIEGYGNSKTGELWVRPITSTANEKVVLTGSRVVEGQAQAIIGSSSPQVGYLPLDRDAGVNTLVQNDGVLNSNPDGTIEFYSIPKTAYDSLITLTMAHPHFDQFTTADCMAAKASQGGPGTAIASDFNSGGVGCVHQHIGNFTTMSFNHVYFDPDVYQSGQTAHVPWGYPYITGSVNGPTGNGARNAPSSNLGLWDFGAVGPKGSGNLVDLWIFFKNGDNLDFHWTGSVIGEVYETCGNGVDDDGDGVIDNGCGLLPPGDPTCYANADCRQPAVCRGAQLTKTAGMGPGAVDMPGTCAVPDFTQMKGGASSNDQANSLVTDANDNSYVLLAFSGGPTDFGDGTTLTSFGSSSDTVLVSYDPLGNTRWVRQIGTTSREDTHQLAIGQSGHLFVVGTTYDGTSLEADTTPANDVIGGSGIRSYVISYDTDGTFRWGKILAPGEGNAVATNVETGDVYVGGFFNGAFDFGDGFGTRTPTHSDMFIASYSDNGSTTHWVKDFGCSAVGGQVRALATDLIGNVYVGSMLQGTCDLGGGSPLAQTGPQTAAVAAYSGTGVYLWSKSYPATLSAGGAGQSYVNAIAADNNAPARVGVGVVFSDTINFGGGAVATQSGGQGSTLLTLDAATGAYAAQRDFLGGQPFTILGLAVDSGHNFFVSGNQNNSGGDLGSGALPSGAMVGSYDGNGGYRSAMIAGGSAYPLATGISVLTTGDLMVTGNTNTGVDWGTGIQNTSGFVDSFLTRINQLPVLNGLLARYDARDVKSITQNISNRVSQWNDSSGHAYALLQPSTPVQPAYVPNAFGTHPGIDFSGSNYQMFANNVPLGNAVTVFAVFKMQSAAPTQQWGTIIGHGQKDNDWALEQNGSSGSLNTLHFQSNNDNAGDNAIFNPDDAYIAVGTISGTSRSFYVTSKDTAVQDLTTTGNSISTGSKQIIMGMSLNNEASHAMIGEILYYNRALTVIERNTVIDYLKTQWGI